MATALEKALDWGTKLPAPGGVINYYFYENGEALPAWGPGDDDPGVTQSEGMTAYEQQQFERAFAIYETFLNVHFFEVDNAGAADINLVSYYDDSRTLGFMYPPGEGQPSGFGFFNYNGAGWDWNDPGAGLEQGGFGFVTIIHELGHGMGLAHPHDNGGTSTVFPGVSSAFDDYGDFDLNQGVYTMMSYNDGWQRNPSGDSPSLDYGYQGTPMALDIAVLQSKYGANTAYNTGNDTYFLPKNNSSGTFYSCIWDAGGTDGIVYTGSPPVLIDLRAATLKVEAGGGGFLSYADGIYGGFTIANGVVIENATGGTGDDWLQGNDVANLMQGRGGSDTLDGAGGTDTLRGNVGADTLLGRSGADRLIANAGRDKLKGHSGDDLLYGGRGKDTLTGGAGSDAFVFAEKAKTTKADTLTDFDPGQDIIWLDQSFFKKAGPLGTLTAGKFHTGDGAHDRSDRIVYNDDTGALIYDRNGSKAGGAKTFAHLDDGLDVTHADFLVVA